ncbi:helix-turn-helix domain-containing protein [Enterovirga aerilata]|uniref:Helix-turn-helix transcriptional regulator n=1 Tax=Enterovirga aerilata TaxID=2730920 RepID=A0A849I8Y8_9HYPH|nr:helix-turn-helix transcriptional regulator [Enterovirga sp. DB1703]NNM73858.1 helix-turn-helix transcriptional regulator [Enterovirga sp. DB1703]
MTVMDRKRGTPLPYEADRALKSLGKNLRTARLRRNLTLDDVAKRIGVHRTTLAQAERGDPTVTAGTYVTACWVYGLANDVAELAAPERDAEGLALEASKARSRARPTLGGMSNDF